MRRARHRRSAVHGRGGEHLFIRPYTVHCVSFPPDSECYFLYFSAECLQDGFVSAEAAAHDATLLSRPELAPFVYQAHCEYKLERDEVEIARKRCLRIQECCGTRGVYDAIEARAELVLLLTAVARKYQLQFSVLQSSVCSEGVIDSRARAALEFIQRNFRSSLSLSEVASHVHLTGTYLTHLLKQELGKSFKQLVDDVRLENSKNLLAYTDARMQKIALESGFLDQAHFAKRFKALTQLTPGQFRREHQASLTGGQ